MADKIQWAGNTMPKSDDKHLGIMSLDHVKKARAFHQSFPQYTVTPLARLDGQAARLGLSNLCVKDESYRFGLNAFKVLGGSFAMANYIADETGKDVADCTFDYLTSDQLAEDFGQATFFTATDGKLLKSSTIFIRNDEGKPVGILGINFDITLMKAFERSLDAFTGIGGTGYTEPEPITKNIGDLLEDLLHECEQFVGKPAALMTKDERIRGKGCRRRQIVSAPAPPPFLGASSGMHESETRPQGKFHIIDECEYFERMGQDGVEQRITQRPRRHRFWRQACETRV